MKFTKYLLIASLLVWQVTACADSDHKHDHHEDHKEHHDDKPHEDHAKDDHKDHDHDEHKHDDHKDHKDHAHDEHEEHGAHEHGVAQMTMAVGGDGLEIEMKSPAYNLFGFGHKATSAEDKKTLNDNKDKLEQVASLFTIDKDAGCEPVKTELESPLFEDHDDHSHEHKDEKHEGEGHSDVEAHWTFKCKNAKEIHDVDVNIFSKFPGGFEKIKVDWITPTKASSVTLTKDGTVELH